MSEFFVSIAKDEIARQVANMINQHNRWYTKLSSMALLTTQVNYFVEIYGQQVVACVGAIQEFPSLSKIMHVCVLPEFRRKHLASKLVNIAINNCNTEFVYMTVREDNMSSLAMANSLRFRFIRRDWFRDHFTHTLARRRIND